MMGEPDDNQEECPTCESTGYICSWCSEPDGGCTCPSPLVACPDCSDWDDE